MSLRVKTALTGFLLFLVLFAALHVAASRVLVSSFDALESDNAVRSAGSVLRIIDSEESQLLAQVKDWASWDDTYQLVQGTNPDYMAVNLPDATFANLELSAVIVADSTGHIVYGKGFDTRHGKKASISAVLSAQVMEGSPLLNTQGSSGIIYLPEGLMLVAARPILTSNGTGPARGTLLFGRYLDGVALTEMARLVNTQIGITRFYGTDELRLHSQVPWGRDGVHNVYLRPDSEGILRAHVPLSDIYGRQTALLTLSADRNIHLRGIAALRMFDISLAVLGIAFTLLSFLATERLVLRRLSRLRHSLKRIDADGDLSGRVDDSGEDEVSRFAQAVNVLLENCQCYGSRNTAILTALPDNMILLDESGKLVDYHIVRPEHMFEDPAVCMGRSILQMLPEEPAKRLESAMKASRETGSVQCFEYEVASPNGSLRQCEARIVMTSEGQYLGIIRDISEHHASEQALRASEERFRTLFDAMSEGFALHELVFDENGKPCDYRFIEVNQAFEDITGITREQAVGKCAYECIPGLEPYWLERYSRVALTGEPMSFDDYSGRLDKYFEIFAFSPGERLFATLFADTTVRRRAEQAVKESEENYRAIFDAVNDAICVLDIKTYKVVDTNSRARQLLGESSASDRSLCDLAAVVDSPLYTAENARWLLDEAAQGRAQLFEWPLGEKDGQPGWVEVHVERASVRGKDRLLAVVRDITERKLAEASLSIQISAINAAGDQVMITSADGIIEFVNPAFERATGYTYKEVIGRHWRMLSTPSTDQLMEEAVLGRVRSGESWHGEIYCKRKDDVLITEDATITPIKNDSGAIEHVIAIKRDITEKKQYEATLDQLAHHDVLTGLPNRLLFSDRLTQRLADARRSGNQIAVMFLDLDRFKLVNDSLGHNAGDLLLRQVSDRLKTAVREADTVARMGGDEFTIILSHVECLEDAAIPARRIIDALSEPFTICGHDLYVTTSIGISVYPADGSDVESLVRAADTAMYHAKESGRNTSRFYTEALNVAAMERMTLESSLRKAIERNQLLAHYQPRVDINTGKLLGTESLVRWMHPELNLIPPAQFIPLAEETGLIVSIGEWMLRTSCLQNKAWQDAGLPKIGVGVNISARQFQLADLVTIVKKVLDESGLDPQYLDLELTESTLMMNSEHAVKVLTKLKSMGVRIYLDDFGTGYSSLSHLKNFPIDVVKIDGSFVRNITTDPDDAAIAGAIVAMAHSLKLRVVAEGVETLEQLNFLRSLECDEMQGYFVGRPVPADDLARTLQIAQLLPTDVSSRARIA